MTRVSPAKFVAAQKSAPGGDAATSLPTEGARPTPTSQEEIVMPHSIPDQSQPVLPLAAEARIAIRNMRIIASNMRQSDDDLVAGDSYALEDLADALERSAGGAVVPNHSPAIVDVLTRVDAKSLRESADAENMHLLRMRDGSTPTDAEVNLILRATEHDLQAAADALQDDADREYARQQKRNELVRLIQSYAEPMETTETFLPRMSDEDQARFHELTEYFK